MGGTSWRLAVLAAAVCLLGAWSPPKTLAAVRYVKADAAGTSSGLSWGDAYTDLQAALAAATAGDEIWVAAGTYKPTSGADRTISFGMVVGVAIYGGFAGTEGERDERDWATHVTILSGDIGTMGNTADNSYHVITGANDAVLNGFTITSGHANGSPPHDRGGGMYNSGVSPTVGNCTFSDNLAAGTGGGGIYNSGNAPSFTNCKFDRNAAGIYGGGGSGGGMHNSNAFVVASDCSFNLNFASTRGGGMYNYRGSFVVTRCTFSDNPAGFDGGGISSLYSSSAGTVSDCIFTGNTATQASAMENLASIIVTGCVFAGNTSFGDFGAMLNLGGSSHQVVNCIFTGNTGGALWNSASSVTITNCTFNSNTGYVLYSIQRASVMVVNSILWNPAARRENYPSGALTTYHSCDIRRSGGSGAAWDTALGSDGGGNIDADPMFADAANPTGGDGTWRTTDDGLRLIAGSPCIDAGTADGAPFNDILGNPRDQVPDIGAYENVLHPTAVTAWTLYD